MFEQKANVPVAETEREGLVERRTRAAPGQKLILGLTSAVAAGLILFGVASRNNFFGLFGASAPTSRESDAVGAKTLAAPEVRVPLNLGSAPSAEPARPNVVLCEGGLRLPVGLDCPPAGPKERATTTAPAQQAAKEGPTEEERVRERRRKSAISIASTQAAPSGAPGMVSVAGVTARGASFTGLSAAAGGSGNTSLGSALAATSTPATRATINRNPSMTLAKGTLPDCTLLTAIQTDQPGFIKCVLSAPVMSMDGRVVLMEAGTTMEGEYTQGAVAGKSSIFTLWSRAVTPKFVSVELDSPGTDALGRAGTSGDIDNKWFERFAGAVFFSLFEDAKQIAIARQDARAAARANANANGNTFNLGSQGTLSRFSNTDGTSRAIVEEMLKQGSDIRPSLYKNQGEIIKIFIARDVDFSGVYELRPSASR